MISAEFKKTLSKPGIYVLIILLAAILVVSGLFFSPKSSVPNLEISLNGDTVGELYTSFVYNEKVNYDALLAQTYAKDNFYRNLEDVKQGAISIIAEMEENINYLYLYSEPNYIITLSELDNIRNEILDSAEAVVPYLRDKMNLSTNGQYLILGSDNTLLQVNALLSDVVINFSASVSTKLEYKTMAQNYKSSTQGNDLRVCLNKFVYPTLSEDFLANIFDISDETKISMYEKIQERLLNIMSKINLLNDQMTPETEVLPANIDLIKKYASEYCQKILVFKELVQYTIQQEILKDIDENTVATFKNFETYTEYGATEMLSVYQYLFDKNQTISNYAYPFAFGMSSNANTNAYDFAFYVLEIFVFILIIFAIANASGSISGEISSGTMKFIAIRPIQRRDIYYGKLFSILLTCAIVLLFGAITSMITGYIMYGTQSLPILTVLNATNVMVLEPIILLTLFMLSSLLKILVYILIGLALSCLLKSNVLSVVIASLLYFGNIIIRALGVLTNFMKFNPLANLDFYDYFAGIRGGNSTLQLISDTITGSGDIMLTAFYIVSLTIVLTVISLICIRKKEF
ncbi:MAG: ABC transporter permease [Clostridia bacterium]|nr:ABC transporter permease [Clostridia bacterium]